ncbi:MAG TPA: hypothetical protein VEZ15_12030 [Acidimicrobiia bacterium]|nr:hypothetical protein [Acidimicrobiia bacterium]
MNQRDGAPRGVGLHPGPDVADCSLLDEIETLQLDRSYDYPIVRRHAALNLVTILIIGKLVTYRDDGTPDERR